MNDMHDIVKLKEMLIKELNGFGQTKELSTGSLEMIDKLAHAVKNLCKIIESGEQEDYSNDGSYRGSYRSMRGSYRGSYDDASYRRRDSMGRYSREDGYSRDEKEDELRDIVNQLRAMAKDLPQPTQRAIQNFTDMVG